MFSKSNIYGYTMGLFVWYTKYLLKYYLYVWYDKYLLKDYLYYKSIQYIVLQQFLFIYKKELL